MPAELPPGTCTQDTILVRQEAQKGRNRLKASQEAHADSVHEHESMQFAGDSEGTVWFGVLTHQGRGGGGEELLQEHRGGHQRRQPCRLQGIRLEGRASGAQRMPDPILWARSCMCYEHTVRAKVACGTAFQAEAQRQQLSHDKNPGERATKRERSTSALTCRPRRAASSCWGSSPWAAAAPPSAGGAGDFGDLKGTKSGEAEPATAPSHTRQCSARPVATQPESCRQSGSNYPLRLTF